MTYCALAGLGEEEVGNDTLDGTPDDEDDVRLPFDLLNGDWPGELVDQAGGIDEETLESHTLRSDFERDTLDWVESLERSNVERVNGAKDKDEGQDGVGGGIIVELGIAVGDTARDQGVGESACRCRHANPDYGGTEETSQHKLPTAKHLNEVGTDDGRYELNNGIAQLDVGLANRVINANGVEDRAEEVRQNVVATNQEKSVKIDQTRAEAVAGHKG